MMNEQLELFEQKKKIWEQEVKSCSQRDYDFNTLSGEPLDLLYIPNEPDEDYLEKLGFPGQCPYTR